MNHLSHCTLVRQEKSPHQDSLFAELSSSAPVIGRFVFARQGAMARMREPNAKDPKCLGVVWLDISAALRLRLEAPP